MEQNNLIRVTNLELAEANAPQGSRFVLTASVLDDSKTGGFFGRYMTAAEERAANEANARFVEAYGD